MSMLDDDLEMRKVADGVVETLLAEGLAEKISFTNIRVNREYWVLATPGAFDKPLLAVAVLGYPEQVGVWSYTLVRQGRLAESSMRAYVQEFGAANIGLIALNPNCFEPDLEGDTFHYQLERVVSRLRPDQRLALVGFSMGGRIVIEFIQRQPELAARLTGLVLIDPTLPGRLQTTGLREVLDRRTLLIASAGEHSSPGDVASVLLNIPKVSFTGIHGQMPNAALKTILAFLQRG